MRRQWRKPVALAMTAALVLAACGDDDDDDGGGGDTTEAAGAPDTTTADTDAPATTGGEDTATTTGDTEGSDDTATTTGDTEGGEEGAGQYGLIDGVYVGADDLVLDPADCPEDWDPMQGVTDTEIRFFSSMPKAGPLAGFGLIGDGIQSYFDYINEQGGIDGRMLQLEVRDDGYLPDRTVSNVDEALGSGDYAGMLTIIGTPNNLAVWDTLNDECMPQLLNGTGAPQWGDVENHPWTTGMQIDYASEAGLWAEWLQAEHPDATRVAAIAFNNDFGMSYVDGFERFIEGTELEVVDQQFHEPTAPDLTNQFTTMAATDADVVLIETSGTFCTQAMSELERNTEWNPIVIMSATCASLSQFFQPLIDQGLTGEGTHLIQYVKDVNDVAFAEDEIVQLFKETATAQGLDASQTTYATGWLFALYMEHILREAATFEGGLDRGNIAVAARQINFQNPLVLDGIVQETSGFRDAYLNEGGQMAVYEVEDPTQLGTFVATGELIDNNGAIGTYSDFLEGG